MLHTHHELCSPFSRGLCFGQWSVRKGREGKEVHRDLTQGSDISKEGDKVPWSFVPPLEFCVQATS